MPVDERFDRLEREEEREPPPTSRRFDLLADVLRRAELEDAEDRTLADPGRIWHRIDGGDDAG